MTDQMLMEKALLARKMAYAPYSHFQVGAALLTEDGEVFTGCNIESCTYSPSNCAERTALFKAVSEGHRKFAAIAITGGPQDEEPVYTAPCGVCRQMLAEFCRPDFRIILREGDGSLRVFTLKDLLPETFLLGQAEAAQYIS